MIDGTFKVVKSLQLMIIGTDASEDGIRPGTNFIMLACLFTNRKTKATYQRWFHNLSRAGLRLQSGQDGVTDMEFGISNAASEVWPGTLWRLCWFHVKMNTREKMTELHLPANVTVFLLKKLDEMHGQAVSSSRITWNEISNSFRSCEVDRSDEEKKKLILKCIKWVDYMEKYYIPHLNRWCGEGSMTNNLIE